MNDAKDFVAGKNPPNSAAANKTSTKKDAGKFYAVARGIKPGIYTDWETASVAISGAKGPKYKKFATMDDAKAFMNEWKQADINVFRTPEQEDDEQPPAKKTKTAASGGDNPGNLDMDVIKIFTDGSCLGNGIHGATAGVGVYFGRGDSRYNDFSISAVKSPVI
jgi:ribonuclease HI